MTSDETTRWTDPARKPFRLFKSIEEELSVDKHFWHGRTPDERMEYLEFMRCVIYGEEVVNAKIIRCYGWQKFGEEDDPKNIVYF